MKRFKFNVETVTGKDREIVLDGNSSNEALLNFSSKKFVRDQISSRMINTDHIVDIELVSEVKVDEEVLT